MKTKQFIIYSETALRSYFNQFLKKNQVSAEILKSPELREALINHIVQKHLVFVDALLDPTCDKNLDIIRKHSTGFFNKNDYSNSQMRGPQVHVSHQIYNNFYTPAFSLTGVDLCINTNDSYVVLQDSMSIASPNSFRHGIEISGARFLSRATGDSVYMTDDKPMFVHLPPNYLKNTPPSQTHGDYVRYKNFEGSPFYIEEDGKSQSPGVAELKKFPQVAMIGSVNFENVEKKLVVSQARQAMMGIIQVRHIGDDKETLGAILRDLEKTGKIEDARGELLGFPYFLSNRHNTDDVD